jgi:hypothetical protein
MNTRRECEKRGPVFELTEQALCRQPNAPNSYRTNGEPGAILLNARHYYSQEY